MPTKKPRGEELTLEQQLANQVLHNRRLRIEHVNSSGKRSRMVKDLIRLWQLDGLSARRMAVWCTFREPSLCHHVHREFMRNAVLDLTPIIPATACHQRN